MCLDTADTPPIYQCPEGHLLCRRCNQRLVDCPQCGHALMNSRNRTAEDLAIKLQVNLLLLLLCLRLVHTSQIMISFLLKKYMKKPNTILIL